MIEMKSIYQLFDNLRSEHDRYRPIWDDISAMVGIQVDSQYIWNQNENKSRQLDYEVDDPTAAIAVNQQGDQMAGIVWGTGEDVLMLEPVEELYETTDSATLRDYFGYATRQLLKHFNDPRAGFSTALKPYFYDQAAFGTSGIGLFVNREFLEGREPNAFIFRNYGVDNTVIGEGRNGLPEHVFVYHHWTAQRIVDEFFVEDGVLDKEDYAKMPQKVRAKYESQDVTQCFRVVYGLVPQVDFKPEYKGKRGSKYMGVWWLDDERAAPPLRVEYYNSKPIAMARQIKIRGSVYGRSSGTMLLSTIKGVDFMVGTVIEILEKLSNPALGIWNGALVGDNVLDTSSDSLVVFNNEFAPAGRNPTFPLYDVGDPSGIIQFLLPYLNEKVMTAFKIDLLLDFSTAKEMTATEALRRFAIRGKSLSGMLQQQKTELLDPLVERGLEVLEKLGELGVDPIVYQEEAQALTEANLGQRIIPESVLALMKSKKRWYKVRYNNELDKLSRVERVEDMIRLVQGVAMMAQFDPDVIQAVDWYAAVAKMNESIRNEDIILDEGEFAAKLQQMAQMQAQAMQMQQASQQANSVKNLAQAEKASADAESKLSQI